MFGRVIWKLQSFLEKLKSFIHFLNQQRLFFPAGQAFMKSWFRAALGQALAEWAGGVKGLCVEAGVYGGIKRKATHNFS